MPENVEPKAEMIPRLPVFFIKSRGAQGAWESLKPCRQVRRYWNNSAAAGFGYTGGDCQNAPFNVE